MANDIVELSITKAEAIILFEAVAKLASQKPSTALDEAEQKVLWIIEAMLEKKLSEPFREDYQRLVGEARLQVLEDI